ncbi:MAG TPA: DUF5678 domain-containing protein [Blastocatellia bacterium]|nr:DUF5678 domain-containing protein [Blastocatellia bacterium]HMV84134.1 DUF5678 domain-containing protein [Blastocatellia bacterium]HMX29453.1 DUF5678 domain-containing protein [Blastocatellia bacterium]HMY74581.1 DUF5678 domain-containing protein [Blastocatellia bacterium]HMZ19862.1 DUF5678 domain-containing protein [Blastocatellia bacterium]
MSTITVENILRQIDQLPSVEQSRPTQLLEERRVEQASQPAKAPRDKRLPDRPAIDDTRERAWIAEHRHEYPGQWVALDGDRLVAASASQAEVWAAVKADGAKLPLVCRIPAPDEPLPIGI